MNKIFEFLRKYWLCFLFSVLMVVGIFLSTAYKDMYESGSGYIRFDLSELYLIFGMPLYSLIYGCLSYVVLRKVWVPQLILFVIAFIYWFRFDIDALFWAGTFIWSVYPIVFSLLSAGITAYIYYIIKSIKEKRK